MDERTDGFVPWDLSTDHHLAGAGKEARTNGSLARRQPSPTSQKHGEPVVACLLGGAGLSPTARRAGGGRAGQGRAATRREPTPTRLAGWRAGCGSSHLSSFFPRLSRDPPAGGLLENSTPDSRLQPPSQSPCFHAADTKRDGTRRDETVAGRCTTTTAAAYPAYRALQPIITVASPKQQQPERLPAFPKAHCSHWLCGRCGWM